MQFSEVNARGVSKYLVAASLDPQQLRIHITEVGPGSRSHGVHTHAGVEAFYVLEGQATVEVEGTLYTLGPNEALALDASRPHGILNSSSAPVRYIVIISQTGPQ